jgi:hypothetical protein
MKKNDLVAFTYWTKVGDAQTERVSVEDVDTGEKFEVKGKPLIDASHSADAFTSTEKVTKTQIAEQLTKSHNFPLTVVFRKQDDTLRTLRGRLLSSEPLLGRSYCEDLDLPKGTHRTRLVDHRTIECLIVNSAKYILK